MADEEEDPSYSGDEGVPSVVTTVLERLRMADAAGLGAGVRKVVMASEAWPDKYLLMSRIHLSDEFYAADSKKKPGQESPDHLKGDLKKPAHEQVHWWVGARHPELRLAFNAHWREGTTPKGGRSFAFIGASAADPLGIPTELFVDYSIGAADEAQLKDEPEWAHHDRVARIHREAEERDRRYNDGKSYYNRFPLFRGAGASGRFLEWLEEANGMVAAVTQRKEAA